MKEEAKEYALMLLNKQIKKNKISIIDIWDIELELEKKYPSIGEDQIINIVKEDLNDRY